MFFLPSRPSRAHFISFDLNSFYKKGVCFLDAFFDGELRHFFWESNFSCQFSSDLPDISGGSDLGRCGGSEGLTVTGWTRLGI